MKITVYAKNHKTHDGRSFATYVTRLVKKDGSEVSTALKFNNGTPIPGTFPCNLIIEKDDANYTERVKTYEKDGETKEYTERTLWVKKWEMGEPFEDHSLDDFE